MKKVVHLDPLDIEAGALKVWGPPPKPDPLDRIESFPERSLNRWEDWGEAVYTNPHQTYRIRIFLVEPSGFHFVIDRWLTSLGVLPQSASWKLQEKFVHENRQPSQSLKDRAQPYAIRALALGETILRLAGQERILGIQLVAKQVPQESTQENIWVGYEPLQNLPASLTGQAGGDLSSPDQSNPSRPEDEPNGFEGF